jgi:hypothetical protein
VTAPASYVDRANLATSPDFLKQIRVAATRVANRVLLGQAPTAETISAAQIKQRGDFATRVVNGDTGALSMIAWVCASMMNPNNVQTDAALDTFIISTWDQLSGVQIVHTVTGP